ncbi:acyl-CoA dehydrogenase family protein [Gordonia sp. DT30]|uniref:acyl-CoA dehydrogenase family protein n=1 Tax=Gordonia sp. DT30 TaxID=3416546 RepID=UPI003CEF8D9D
MRRSVYGDDHDSFRKSLRDFVDRVVEPNAETMIEDRRIPRDIWRRAGDNGFLGLQVPEQYGGGEASDYRFTAVLIEELSRSSAALASAFSIHSDIVAPYLVDLTTDDQKHRWLPGFCAGEIVTAIGMTEPSGGSDLAALKSTAIRQGDDWILNGSKIFITNGFHADLVIVAARTRPDKGSKGITLFGVESGMPGFERGRKLKKVGQPEADTAELFFSDVRVPSANVIGEVDRGFVHMMERLPQERLGGAVSNIAHVVPIFEDTIEYIKQRKAFGKSIGSLQWNKFLAADLATRIDVTQAYIDNCIAAHSAGELTPTDAAKAKWWSAQVQNDVLDACVQLYGGYGYMTEYRVARAWMDARVTKIWAGSNEIMKELIGRDLGL